jgi:ABC-2 type transport system permease protein
MPSLLSRNMLLIARREYLEQIRGRSFRLSTILLPLLVLFVLGISTFTGRKAVAHRHIAIAADNPALAEDIRSQLVAENHPGYIVDVEPPSNNSLDAENLANLERPVKNKSLDGLLLIQNSSTSTPSVIYIAQSSGDLMDTSRLEDAINRGFLDLRLEQQGVPQQQIHALANPVHLQTLQMEGSGQTRKSQGMSPFFKAMFMTFFMTMPIILYGMDMARSIIEEKSSRIFEVMLAVARPDDMLTGKLLGVGAVGLTQIAIWVAAATLLSGTALMSSIVSGDAQLHFSPLEAILFPVYFVLGFFLYSAFFSGLASTCETAQDLQMYVPMAIVPTWISFAILPFLLNNPNSPWVVAASIFPPTAPFLMVPRLGMSTSPSIYWQIALSIALLILSIWAMIWFASRLYRIGILMYGKRATLPEILRWLRYS